MDLLKKYIYESIQVYLTDNQVKELYNLLVEQIDEDSTNEDINKLISQYVSKHGLMPLLEFSTKLANKITTQSIKANALKLEILKSKRNNVK